MLLNSSGPASQACHSGCKVVTCQLDPNFPVSITKVPQAPGLGEQAHCSPFIIICECLSPLLSAVHFSVSSAVFSVQLGWVLRSPYPASQSTSFVFMDTKGGVLWGHQLWSGCSSTAGQPCVRHGVLSPCLLELLLLALNQDEGPQQNSPFLHPSEPDEPIQLLSLFQGPRSLSTPSPLSPVSPHSSALWAGAGEQGCEAAWLVS